MSSSLPSNLDIGTILVERYRVDAVLGPGAYSGTDQQGDVKVRLIAVGADVGSHIDALRKVSHAHLVKILDFVKSEDGSGTLVTEHVDGPTLAEREVAENDTLEAVRSALRVADALSHLHDAGAVHGAVSPEALVLVPEGRDAAPTLTFFPTAEDSLFRSPTRRNGGAASEADDAWACAALLHQMLSGKPPPAGGVASEDDLFTADLADNALRSALLHALNANESERSPSLRPLKRELARWFVEHSDEEAATYGHMSSQPPPLPSGGSVLPVSGLPSGAPRPSRAPTTPPKSKRRVPLLAVSAIVLGLVAAYAVSSFRSREKIKYVPQALPEPTESSDQAAIALGEVPVTGEQDAATGNEMATCVAGYLPKGAFGDPPDLSFVCSETQPERGGEQLRAALVRGAPKGLGPTEAMTAFSQLGWYSMAAFAVVRAGCCVDAKPLSLPEPAKGCEPMTTILQSLGSAVVAGNNQDELLMSLDKTISCEIDAGHGNQFHGSVKPAKSEQTAFRKLVGALKD